MLTLELVLEQNTKLVERLDRTMDQLSQSVTDLRMQMIQGHAELRQEITQCRGELRHEMAQCRGELRQEIAHSQAELHKFVERKFNLLMTSYCAVLLTVVGFLGKYLIDLYLK